MENFPADASQANRWLKRFFFLLALLLGLTLLLAAPVAALWIYQSGDLAVDRAVRDQQQGFVLYGSGLPSAPRDTLAYKMSLYREKKPQIVIAGSGSMASLRDSVFAKPVVNMAGTCSSLSSLRQSIDAMVAIHKPDIVVLALDFWWFSDAWEKDPFVRTGFDAEKPHLSPEVLRLPLQSLLNGSISLPQFLFLDFSKNRFGMRAQFHDEGYGPDGSYFAGDKLMKPSADAGFMRTMDRARHRIGEFAPQAQISQAHLDAMADIYFRLRGRGITPLVCLAPLPGRVMDLLKENQADYPHLFNLRAELEARGIVLTETPDVTTLEGNDCEFLDGTHAGEVMSLRLLSQLSSSWTSLYSYLNMEQLTRLMTEWKGHASVGYEQTGKIWETDFLGLGCVKKTR